MNGTSFINGCKRNCVLDESLSELNKGRIVVNPITMLINHGIREVQ